MVGSEDGVIDSDNGVIGCEDGGGATIDVLAASMIRATHMSINQFDVRTQAIAMGSIVSVKRDFKGSHQEGGELTSRNVRGQVPTKNSKQSQQDGHRKGYIGNRSRRDA